MLSSENFSTQKATGMFFFHLATFINEDVRSFVSTWFHFHCTLNIKFIATSDICTNHIAPRPINFLFDTNSIAQRFPSFN